MWSTVCELIALKAHRAEDEADTSGYYSDETSYLIRGPKIPDACANCPNHPSNGGSGTCACTLGSPTIN